MHVLREGEDLIYCFTDIVTVPVELVVENSRYLGEDRVGGG
jgi:hypothetical protein